MVAVDIARHYAGSDAGGPSLSQVRALLLGFAALLGCVGVEAEAEKARAARVDGYAQFLESKLARAVPTGIADVDRASLSARMFAFQSDVTAWALRRGRAALFMDTGLGKSLCEIEWSRNVAAYTERPTLILTPLAVAPQFAREGSKFGVEVTHARDGGDVKPGVNVTNYDRLHLFDTSVFGGVALDECFAEGTPVLTIDATDRMVSRSIESVRVGDRICNASGVDVVADVHRREVPYAVRFTVGDRRVISSPNHPVFTGRGWVAAQDLEPGDGILDARAAMRLVRGDLQAEAQEVIEPAAAAILRAILLSEMANDAAGDPGEGSLAGGGGGEGSGSFGMVRCREPGGRGGAGAHSGAGEGGPVRGGQAEDLPPIARDEARTFRAWGQRAWFDGAAEGDARCARRDVGAGVCIVTGPTDSRLSDALQARLGAARAASSYRGGWELAPRSARRGREEGREAAFAQVDRLEVLEPGHPDLERLRSPDGKLYFYDLGGTRHPSFAVAGLLVHNSSLLKDFTSATRNQLIETFDRTPFKLCGTATPSPNDYTELGNHAEFLGVMSRTEMLATWFTHDGSDTSKWRLKGHAEADFFRWLTTWGLMVKRPSDLGYADEGFALPPLVTHEHVVPGDLRDAWATGDLFVTQAKTLNDQRRVKRATIEKRVALAASLVAAEPDEPWIIWAELNDEADALEKAIHGAVQVAGSDKTEVKETRLLGFPAGEFKCLVSKTSIAGWGLNYQHCARMAFVGVTHSFEAVYQGIRRAWRFGQKRPVHCHFIIAEAEGPVLANVKRKQADAERMAERTREHVLTHVREAVGASARESNPYEPRVPMKVPAWLMSEGA